MFDARRIQSILNAATQTFGQSFEHIAFHAFDDNHMPVGAPLTAEEYVRWLTGAYEHADPATVRSISTQYDAAITSARNSPGILPDALANLILSGEIFHALLDGSTHQVDIPHVPQPAQPHTDGHAIESHEALEHMRDQVMQELGITQTTLSPTELQNIIATLLEKHKKEIDAKSALSRESKDEELKKIQGHLAQQSIILQSINARLGTQMDGESASTSAPTTTIGMPTEEHLAQLKENIARAIEASKQVKNNVTALDQSSQHIQHIATHIQIVEQLLHMIQEEAQN